MNFIIPIILIAVSIGVFMSVIDPKYQDIKKLQESKMAFEEKFQNADKIKDKKDKLEEQYNKILSPQLTKIKKFLPDHIDNIELIVDIDRIAKINNIRNMSDITLAGNENSSRGDSGKIQIKEEEGYESVVLGFSFVSNYQNFQKFLYDLHRSLRLTDVVDISIQPQADIQTGGTEESYMFTLAIRTYWLKK